MNRKEFILKGHICYSTSKTVINIIENGYLISINGRVEGIYKQIPYNYQSIPVIDYNDCLIIPGLIDLHVHAPQYSFRALGMDLELLDWLNTHTFPEESKYYDLEYAKKAYSMFVADLKKGATTRACIFATIHIPATKLLMDLLEQSGLKTMVGKVNMDRNAPYSLQEKSASVSIQHTIDWLKSTIGNYKNTMPILTPRFIPSCTDELMIELKEIQKKYQLPVQSHLSENEGEIAWVQQLCPTSKFYGDAYDQFGLFGGDCKTIMAHCVLSGKEEINRIKERGVYIAHCPQSNINLSSGIAPVRTYLEEDLKIGLGSDMAGGFITSIFRAMSDAIQVSKLRWRLVDHTLKPLTIEEAFYLGTKGGGQFFGKVGSFEQGYEMDAIIIEDSTLLYPQNLTVKERLERVIYLSDERHIIGKYVAGDKIL